MTMLEIDLIDPITPMCLIIGVMYILIIVDYFIRFVWAKSYLKHTFDMIIDIYNNHIFLILRYNKAVYSDNGSYFINQKV